VSSPSKRRGTVAILAIHRLDGWWREVGRNMGYERSVTLSDVRGDGDYNVVDGFYRAFRQFFRARADSSPLLAAEEVNDVIARCRVLRSTPRRKAAAMALAMADVFDRALCEIDPVMTVSLAIDRYSTDVFARIARKRGLPFFELIAAAMSGMSMLLYRGRLVKRADEPDPLLVEQMRARIADPLFTPSYVQGQSAYTRTRFLRVFGYFRLRSLAFSALKTARRDPLNFQALEAQYKLCYKPRLHDLRITSLIDRDWRKRAAQFAPEKRLFIGLQLFPEASIDYWIDDLEMLHHEPLLIRVAQVFSEAGFGVLVKDHPLQYGFRQTALIEELRSIPNVTIVPYEVSGNELVDLCGVNFTCTGTLGMQAALLGRKSIVVPNYYSNPDDFIEFSHVDAVVELPARVADADPPADPKERQLRIMNNLLKGSFDGDYHSFRDFWRGDLASTRFLGQQLGAQVHALGPEGEDWHRSQGVDRWP
jgi:hypothetical protein